MNKVSAWVQPENLYVVTVAVEHGFCATFSLKSRSEQEVRETLREENPGAKVLLINCISIDRSV